MPMKKVGLLIVCCVARCSETFSHNIRRIVGTGAWQKLQSTLTHVRLEEKIRRAFLDIVVPVYLEFLLTSAQRFFVSHK